jgi:hypothetical protein
MWFCQLRCCIFLVRECKPCFSSNNISLLLVSDIHHLVLCSCDDFLFMYWHCCSCIWFYEKPQDHSERHNSAVSVGGSSSTIKRNLLRIRSSQQLFQLYSTSAMVCLSRSSTMGLNPYAVYYQVALNIIDCQ